MEEMERNVGERALLRFWWMQRDRDMWKSMVRWQLQPEEHADGVGRSETVSEVIWMQSSLEWTQWISYVLAVQFVRDWHYSSKDSSCL